MSATIARAQVGPMIGGDDIEAAIIETLKAWLPAYICQGERERGWEVGKTPWPKGWAITGRDLQKLNSDQEPCIVIMAGGITSPPLRQGAPGSMLATWGVSVGSVFNAAWGRASRRHAQLYAVAIRTCLTQRSLEETSVGIKAVIDPLGETYDEMDFAESRSYSTSIASFTVTVDGIGWTSGGPPPDADPPVDPTVPFEPWVEVVSTDVLVEHVLPPQPLPE